MIMKQATIFIVFSTVFFSPVLTADRNSLEGRTKFIIYDTKYGKYNILKLFVKKRLISFELIL